MPFETTLLEIGIVFITIAVGGVIASKTDLSTIPIYIILGLFLGEHVLGRVGIPFSEIAFIGEGAAGSFIEIGAQIGIVFLLFFLGMEFSLRQLSDHKSRISKAGTIDLLNLVVGTILGYIILGNIFGAIIIGGIVYISSSAIITKSLIDLGWIADEESGPILGMLVYEDLFIAIYLAFISALFLGTGGVGGLFGSLLISGGFVAFLVILVYLGTDFFKRLVSDDSDEFTVLRIVGVTLLIAGAGLLAGVSEAVAAFVVGLIFSETEYSDRIEKLVEPIRYVFSGLFFFWIGWTTDPTLFVEVIPLLSIAVVVTGLVKYLTSYYSAREFYDLDKIKSNRVGLGMITRGEFSLVIASVVMSSVGAIKFGVNPQMINAFAVSYVLVMSIIGTTLMHYSDYFERLTGNNPEI